jgi:SAM-dependent methyltransferase
MDPAPLSVDERELLTGDPSTQDVAYRRTAYDYLASVHMVPRFGVLASYVHAVGARSVLDLGCGVGTLKRLLGPGVAYCGVDRSPTAITRAAAAFRDDPDAEFVCTDFFSWTSPRRFDCVVWAGMGMGFTTTDRRHVGDWELVLSLARERLAPGGTLICECIDGYATHLVRMTEGYPLVSECRLECSGSDAHAGRYVRIVRADGDASPEGTDAAGAGAG